MNEEVVLVNTNDEELGTMEKMEAHRKAVLHRAFSVFIFNSKGELLLQQRAAEKYHCGGLWTNTCCSHPRLNEDVLDAAHRRLQEEMGLSETLTYGFSFIYRADFPNNLSEHEFDHVFFGESDLLPQPNPSEVADYKYISLQVLEKEIAAFPDRFSPWMKICLNRVIAYRSA
jgi:isopentenyl-diphosphate delta-isomerase